MQTINIFFQFHIHKRKNVTFSCTHPQPQLTPKQFQFLLKNDKLLPDVTRRGFCSQPYKLHHYRLKCATFQIPFQSLLLFLPSVALWEMYWIPTQTPVLFSHYNFNSPINLRWACVRILFLINSVRLCILHNERYPSRWKVTHVEEPGD